MRRLFAAIVVAFLFGSTPLSAANRDDGALDSIDINSQLIDRMRGSELSESVVAHLRALRASADVSELVQRKANSLLTLAESRKPGAVQPAPIVLPRPTQVQPELSAASEECATALPLSLGEGQRHQLPPFGHVWVRLHSRQPADSARYLLEFARFRCRRQIDRAMKTAARRKSKSLHRE
jgi:hypothetical protein